MHAYEILKRVEMESAVIEKVNGASLCASSIASGPTK